MLTKAFTSREKILLLFLAVMLVLAVYYLTILRPTSEAIAKSQAEITEIENNMITEQTKAGILADMKAVLDKVPESEKNGAQIPDYDNFENVLDELSVALSNASDVKINFSKETVSKDLIIREMQVAFFAENYAVAKSIISNLYAGPYKCDISKATLQLADSATNDITTAKVSALVNIVYYEYSGSEQNDTNSAP